MKKRTIQLDGGTPWGMGYWAKRLQCPAMALLSRLVTPENALSDSFAMNLGSIGHAFLREWYEAKGRFESRSVKIEEVSEDLKELREARRIFGVYKKQRTPTDLGKIVAVEEPYRFDGWDFPYTFKPDLIVKVTKRTAAALERNLHAVVEPGLWLVDHKFVGSAELGRTRYYTEGWQGIIYPRAAREVGFPVHGVLFNFITTGNPSGSLVVPKQIEATDDEAVEIWKDACRRANLQDAGRKTGQCSVSTPFGERMCPYKGGPCNGRRGILKLEPTL